MSQYCFIDEACLYTRNIYFDIAEVKEKFLLVMAAFMYKAYNQKMNGWEYGDRNKISYTKLQGNDCLISNLGALYTHEKQENTTKNKKSYTFPHDITPRMAFKLHAAIDLLLTELTDSINIWRQYLPKIAHSFCDNKSDKCSKWRKQFIASIERILYRLLKGNGLSPNCTAEEVATFIIINIAESMFKDIDLGYKYNENWYNLPKYTFDDNNFDHIRNNSILDETVISSFDEDEDISTVLVYGLHIHPTLWFIAFDENKNKNHEIELNLESEQAQIDKKQIK